MIEISERVSLADEEVEVSAIRAQGAGGQNVNKVSTAIHLRFDIGRSSLPGWYKERLMAAGDRRISKDGVVIIKAQRFRSQEKNRADAIARLVELIQSATRLEKARRATRPTLGSQRRRVDQKTRRGKVKTMRRKVDY